MSEASRIEERGPDFGPTGTVDASTRNELHELGNLIVAVQHCLRRLDGRQRTDELQGVVRTGLEACEQGVESFRRIQAAVIGRNGHSPHDTQERARRYKMRAAEYRAVADQMRDPTARASYRQLAENYDAIGQRLEQVNHKVRD
jgi:hypothetical protein